MILLKIHIENYLRKLWIEKKMDSNSMISIFDINIAATNKEIYI